MRLQSMILGLSLAMGIGPVWAADDYLFNCKNYWSQEVMVTVTADSEAAARKQIKTNKDIIDHYSIDDSAVCAFRAKLKPNPHKKKRNGFMNPMGQTDNTTENSASPNE